MLSVVFQRRIRSRQRAMKLVKSDSSSSSPKKSKDVNGVPYSAIERQLDRILASEVFAAAPRMCQLWPYWYGRPWLETLSVWINARSASKYSSRMPPISIPVATPSCGCRSASCAMSCNAITATVAMNRFGSKFRGVSTAWCSSGRYPRAALAPRRARRP